MKIADLRARTDTSLEARINSTLKEMDLKSLFALYNEYCEATNCTDDYAYFMDDFDEILTMSDYSPTDIASAVLSGSHFNPNDDYFYFDHWDGNLVSYTGDAVDKVLSPCDIAEYIARTGDDLGNDEISEILEEEE